MDINRGPREGTGHIPDTTGVVEVDVRYGYPGQVIGAQPALGKRLEHYRDGTLAPRLDQHRRRALPPGNRLSPVPSRPTTCRSRARRALRTCSWPQASSEILTLRRLEQDVSRSRGRGTY